MAVDCFNTLIDDFDDSGNESGLCSLPALADGGRRWARLGARVGVVDLELETRISLFAVSGDSGASPHQVSTTPILLCYLSLPRSGSTTPSVTSASPESCCGLAV